MPRARARARACYIFFLNKRTAHNIVPPRVYALGLQGRSLPWLLYAHCGITSLTDVQGVQDATVVSGGIASAMASLCLLLVPTHPPREI